MTSRFTNLLIAALVMGFGPDARAELVTYNIYGPADSLARISPPYLAYCRWCMKMLV